jgi:cytochrome c-type biogenesis protein CcmH/NrfF
MGHRLARILLLASMLGVVALPLVAATPAQEAASLSRELMSPFCPGLRLSDCQSTGARDLRTEIRERYEAAETRDAIVADLVARYGGGILGRPAASGVGAWAWFVPAALGLLTVLAIALRVRRWQASGAAAAASPAAEEPAVAARIDAELVALD